MLFHTVQFSPSVVSNSLQPHESQHARPPCPSPTPGVHPKPCPLSRWCHPTISSSVVPFSSCPQSFPASGSFPMSQLFALGGQSFGVSASASVLPMNIQDWFPFIYYFKDSDLYVHYTLSLAYFPQIVNLTWCKCVIFNLLADSNLLWWLILCVHLPGPWAQTFGQTLFWMFLWVCFLNENNILRKAGCPPQCGWASFCQSKAFIGQRLTSPRKKEFYLQVISRLNCNISFSMGPQPDGPSEGFGLAFKAAWANSLYICVCVCVCVCVYARTIFLVHTHAHPIASFLWRTLIHAWTEMSKTSLSIFTSIHKLLHFSPSILAREWEDPQISPWGVDFQSIVCCSYSLSVCLQRTSGCTINNECHQCDQIAPSFGLFWDFLGHPLNKLTQLVRRAA